MQSNSKKHPGLDFYVRALRLPFVSVSVFGFLFGSLISRAHFNFFNFLLGLIAAVSTHLGANLINDYADSKSGADWHDKKSYNFFGGSKLIQEGVFSEQFYLKNSLLCFGIAFLSVIILSLRLASFLPVILYLVILFLGWAYSARPLVLAYHRMGEVIIFLLFGPALVMGGYFIQTGIFPDLKSFLLSIPFGIFTTLILFVNEIPDYFDDQKAKKNNWVTFLGPRNAYLIYLVLCLLAFISILIDIKMGFLGKMAILSFVYLLPAIKVLLILGSGIQEKERYILTSQMTILIHTLVSIVLILDVLL